MWMLHSVAAAYGQRPSSVAGVVGDWEAYQLDVAVLTVGREIENGLAERDRDGQPVRTLEELLGGERREAGFAPLAGRVTRKLAVPESGVW